jgi:hypothetical protein
MYFNSAAQLIQAADKGRLVWEVTQDLASKGRFPELCFVEQTDDGHSLAQRFSGVDSDAARLVILDPRQWALLNGRDNPSRDDIRSMLGTGPTPLVVDNAASCVIASVNTQRRTRALQAAGEVLAWRSVRAQVVDADDDERREVAAQLAAAERRLHDEVARAFQHYAYLARHDDTLEVEHRRIDDDTASALRGTDVWDRLVEAGRAVQPGGLAETYVATLLNGFSRWLTPREIVHSFYTNPQFPLVSSTDEIRRVLFQLIQPAGAAGPGTGGWELVDGTGQHLNVTSAEQIAINSINQSLRPYAPTTATQPEPPGAPQPTPGPPGELPLEPRLPITGPAEPGSPVQPAGEPTYKRYIVDLPNRSLRDPAARESVWKLIRELAKVVDPRTISSATNSSRCASNSTRSKATKAASKPAPPKSAPACESKKTSSDPAPGCRAPVPEASGSVRCTATVGPQGRSEPDRGIVPGQSGD